MKKLKKITSLLVCLILISCGNDNSPKDEEAAHGDTVMSEQDEKMAWWREARFGMFIHWGVYAVPAGEWKGEEIPGISEWIMLRAKIPVNEYEALTEQFNPVKYDAEAWVKMARDAGMKYIVITSKHHVGFAMFKSEASPYNIVDATPFDRDPLKELADACHKQGMKLGFYHSQAQDWHHPGGTYSGITRGEDHWDSDMERKPLMEYIEEKAYPQVKEILTNYGDVDILWWDTPRGMTVEAATKLKSLLEMQPGIIANNRLYRSWQSMDNPGTITDHIKDLERGDFTTPEQHIPPTGLDYDWEVCMTMNTSWGYKHYDNNWKSAKLLIHNLVDIASKGGNYLLNVGPTPEGEIPGESIDRLKEIGDWMDKNGESVYGTNASPFFKLPWGRCTQKTTEGGSKLYLHVFDWPEDGEILVPGLKSRVSRASLLVTGDKLKVSTSGGDAIVKVPAESPDNIDAVVVLEIKGDLIIESNKPVQDENGNVTLDATLGFIHNRGYGTLARLESQDGLYFITDWTDKRAYVEWLFDAAETGEFEVKVLLACNNDCAVNLVMGDQRFEAAIESTGDMLDFKELDLGAIEIRESGAKVLQIEPAGESWSGLNLQQVNLQKK